MSGRKIQLCETDIAVDARTGRAPEWVHLAPIGQITSRDGRKFLLDNPEMVIEAFEANGADLPIDYEHQHHKSSQNGPVPAAGWITAMKATADGVWGKVKWTDRAAQLIEAREYRYLSPVLMCLKDGRITKITGAGLVHNPALQLTALAAEETKMRDTETMVDSIAEKLGLEPDASLDDIMAALQMLLDTEKPSLASEVDPTKYAPVEAMRELMSNRNDALNMLLRKTAEEKVKAAFDSGHLSGGMQKWALELCMKDEASFDEFIRRTPAMFSHLLKGNTRHTYQHTAQSEPHESEEAMEICAQLGLPKGSLTS